MAKEPRPAPKKLRPTPAPAKKRPRRKRPTRKPGRPTLYTPALGRLIAQGISSGLTLHQLAARVPDCPPRSTILRWVRENEEFAILYRQAREDRTEGWVEELVEIGDDAIAVAAADPLNSSAISARRLKSDALKWVAARHGAKTYGDKLDMTVHEDQTDVFYRGWVARWEAAKAGLVEDESQVPPGHKTLEQMRAFHARCEAARRRGEGRGT